MFEDFTSRRERPGANSGPQRRVWTALSLATHALFLFVAAHGLRQSPLRVAMPGTEHGTRIDLAYNPGRAPVPTLKTSSHAPAAAAAKLLHAAAPAEKQQQSTLVEPPRPHLEPLRQSSPPTGAAPSTRPDADAGADALGSGDVEIALTTYAPRPKPDLSTLPHGTQGDVIVDVTIDPAGKVADLQVLQALGYGVENSVLNTVRTWTFRPAKKDGVAVASVQELHFHFGPV